MQSHSVYGYWLNAARVNNVSDGLIVPAFYPIGLQCRGYYNVVH